MVAPSGDWVALDQAAFEKLEKDQGKTEKWTIVFHDSQPRFETLNALAKWAKETITEKPFKFGAVDVEKNAELAKHLDVDYVPVREVSLLVFDFCFLFVLYLILCFNSYSFSFILNSFFSLFSFVSLL